MKKADFLAEFISLMDAGHQTLGRMKLHEPIDLYPREKSHKSVGIPLPNTIPLHKEIEVFLQLEDSDAKVVHRSQTKVILKKPDATLTWVIHVFPPNSKGQIVKDSFKLDGGIIKAT